MSDKKFTPSDMTPQVLADAIRSHVDEGEGGDSSLLEMTSWASGFIAPDREITCGTTLCVGGWGAYLLGYSFDRHGFVSGTSGRPELHISNIVQEALEINDEQAYFLFHRAHKDEALDILHHIAEGNGFPQHVIRRRDEVDY